MKDAPCPFRIRGFFYDMLVKSSLLPLYIKKAETILREQENLCRELIEKGRGKIEALARALIEKNHLNKDEILMILEDG